MVVKIVKLIKNSIFACQKGEYSKEKSTVNKRDEGRLLGTWEGITYSNAVSYKGIDKIYSVKNLREKFDFV